MKRSGRNELILVAIHMYMEAMLEISLYCYLYCKQAKILYVFIIISFVFSSTKLKKKAERVLPGSKEGGGRE
jgi:hypothetical protein